MSTTGEKGKIDEDLAKGLKDAKTTRSYFACVVAGATKGALIVQKQKVPPTAIAAAKKQCNGSMTIKGACYYESGTHVFETAVEAPKNLPDLLKLLAKQQAGMAIHAECRTGNNPDLLDDNTGQGAPPRLTTSAPGANNPTQTPNPTVGNKGPQATPPNRPRANSAPTVMKAYATEADWKQKISQVDNARIPAARKLAAYDLIGNELKADVDRLAQDTTLDQGSKGNLQAAHQRVQQLLTQQRTAADTRSKRDNWQGGLINNRRTAVQKAALLTAKTGPKIQALNADLDQIVAPFSEQAVSDMSDKTDADDSKFGRVLSAMNIFRGANELLKKGQLPYEEFNKHLKKVHEEATAYRESHKSAITPSGKKRIKQCDQVLESIVATQRLVSGKQAEIQAILRDVLNEIQMGGVCPEMRDKILPELLKFPYLSMEFRPQIEKTKAEVIRLLKAKADPALNSMPNATGPDRAEILLQYGGASPPKAKGQSDSFFINNPDGTPAYIFKSQEGEARNNVDWPEGGGAPREILASRMNELMKQQLGLDLKVAKTTLFETEDENFKQGSLSNSPKRSGALQEAITSDPNPSPFAKGASGYSPTVINALNTEDAESIALLDFITLNLDRHSDNMLLQNIGDQPNGTRMVPIDAGQMFPTKAAFRISAGNMSSKNAYDPNGNPNLIEGNFLMQLPGAQQPFSAKSKQAIAQLDADAFVASMKAEFEKVAREAPGMAGKVDDSSFDLMKRSIKLLKKAAAQDLTQRQLSQIYAQGFNKILDAQDDQVDAAINRAVADSKRVKELGGEQELLRRGIDPQKWSIAMQKEILEKNLSPQDAQQAQYAELQGELADLETYLLFENGAKFTLGDRLTRPYSPQDYDFLEAAAEWKKLGGDPRLQMMLGGEPQTLDMALKKPLNAKFTAMQEANDFFKDGGYPALRAAVGDVQFAALAGQEIWQQQGALVDALNPNRPKRNLGGAKRQPTTPQKAPTKK